MLEERQRVLRMLKAGKVTVEEAEALLEALGEEESGAPPAGAVPSGSAGGGLPVEGERPEDRRGEFRQLIEDILERIDASGIVDTVRESLRTSLGRTRVDVHRIRDEVQEAAHRLRDEARKAAMEYRRQGFTLSISQAIEGLWGMADSSGTWSHEAGLTPGSILRLYSPWGEIGLSRSPDERLRVLASKRAWGRDEADARAALERVRIAAGPEGDAYVIRVEHQAAGPPRRYRADLSVQVPAGVSVEVAQTRGDVSATGLDGDLAVRGVSGDVVVRDQDGNVQVDVTRGDISAARVKGEIQARTLHGDVTLEHAEGRILGHSKRGDVDFRHPDGEVVLDLKTASGDVEAEVEQFSAGTTSVLSTMRGDVTARLGPDVRCRLSARTTAGGIRADVPLLEAQRSGGTLRGVVGSPDAALDLSTMSGDVSVVPR